MHVRPALSLLAAALCFHVGAPDLVYDLGFAHAGLNELALRRVAALDLYRAGPYPCRFCRGLGSRFRFGHGGTRHHAQRCGIGVELAQLAARSASGVLIDDTALLVRALVDRSMRGLRGP